MITFEFLETNSRVEKGFPEVRYKVPTQAPVFLLGAVTPDSTVTEPSGLQFSHGKILEGGIADRNG